MSVSHVIENSFESRSPLRPFAIDLDTHASDRREGLTYLFSYQALFIGS